MAKVEQVVVKVDPQVKEDAGRVLAALGMTVSGAVNVFLRKVAETGGIPFDVSLSPAARDKVVSSGDSDPYEAAKEGAATRTPSMVVLQTIDQLKDIYGDAIARSIEDSANVRRYLKTEYDLDADGSLRRRPDGDDDAVRLGCRTLWTKEVESLAESIERQSVSGLVLACAVKEVKEKPHRALPVCVAAAKALCPAARPAMLRQLAVYVAAIAATPPRDLASKDKVTERLSDPVAWATKALGVRGRVVRDTAPMGPRAEEARVSIECADVVMGLMGPGTWSVDEGTSSDARGVVTEAVLMMPRGILD